MCGLDPCSAGFESILVGDEAVAQLSGRMLLLITNSQSQSVSQRGEGAHQTGRRQGEQKGHRGLRDGGGDPSRGRNQARDSRDDEEWGSGRMLRRRGGAGRRRRRLADVEDIAFLVPSEGGTEGEDGEATTESQQAAAFVNNMADPVSDGRNSIPLANGVGLACRGCWAPLLVLLLLRRKCCVVKHVLEPIRPVSFRGICMH